MKQVGEKPDAVIFHPRRDTPCWADFIEIWFDGRDR